MLGAKNFMTSKAPLITIIIPVHNEEKNVPLAYVAIYEIFKKLPYRFEIVYIDDGSTDGSAAAIEKLQSKHKNVRFIQLARNFGKEIALSAGLHEAKGDAVIMMDADLQHPPEHIPEFIDKWEKAADIVVGVRKSSGHSSLAKSAGSKIFYKLMNIMSTTEVIPHATDYRLVDRQVVEQYNRFTERNRITRGLFDWLGFERDIVHFTPAERKHGTVVYSWRKLYNLAMHSFIGHSAFPLRMAGYLGAIITIVSLPLGIYIFFDRYVLGDPFGLSFSGPAILAVINLFLSGIILLCLGLIARYIENIHNEVNNRPLYVTKKRRLKK